MTTCTAPPEATFSTPEVERLTGVSVRRIDYMIRQGHFESAVPASGSGSRRKFNLHQVLVLRAVGIYAESVTGGAPEVRGADSTHAIELLARIPTLGLCGPVELRVGPRAVIQLDLALDRSEKELASLLAAVRPPLDHWAVRVDRPSFELLRTAPQPGRRRPGRPGRPGRRQPTG